MFNSGVNPKKGGVMSDGSNIREEVAAIIYVSTTEHSQSLKQGLAVVLTKLLCKPSSI